MPTRRQTLAGWLLATALPGAHAQHIAERYSLLVIFTLGIGLIVALPMWLVLALAWIVCTLLAAFKAYDGQPYRYPITIRLFK